MSHFQSNPNDGIVALVKAVDFAARMHIHQRRKNSEAAPYINHPIGAAMIAAFEAGITDIAILQAAVLHDTIEDTDATYEQIADLFGSKVADIVAELSDDQSLPKDVKKQAQIEHVKIISDSAKLVKLCDKLYNLRDLISNPPPSYSLERVQGYCVFSKMVVAGARGINVALESALDTEIFGATFVFQGQVYPCCPDDLDECHVFPKQ